MPEFTCRHAAKSVDELDAGLFTGDAFADPENRAALRAYMARWERRLVEWEEITADQA